MLALLWTGGHPPKESQDVMDQIKALDGDFNFEVYMSLTCHNCPDVVQALAHGHPQPQDPNHRHRRRRLPGRSGKRQIMAVPMVFLNGQLFASGRMGSSGNRGWLDTNSAEREAADPAPRRRMTLIVGGGRCAPPLPCLRRPQASAWAWPSSALAAR